MPRQRAEHGNVGGLHRMPDQVLMARACDAIEDHAGNAHARTIVAQTRRHGGRSLRLPRGIEHQEHRPAHHLGNIGTGPGTRAARRGDAVEEAHRAFGKHQVSIAAAGHQRLDGRARHRPAIQIDGSSAGCRGMERGIDIIGPALEALHRKSAIAEGARQRQRQRGLAGAGGRRRNDERARHHAPSGNRGAAPTGR
jgi:hypothetical protein